MKTPSKLYRKLNWQLYEQLDTQLSEQLYTQLYAQLSEQLHRQLSEQLHWEAWAPSQQSPGGLTLFDQTIHRNGGVDKWTLNQIKLFEKTANRLEENLSCILDKHILNSNGFLHFPEKLFDMVRLGITLFGSYKNKNLLQVSKLKSVISQNRNIKNVFSPIL